MLLFSNLDRVQSNSFKLNVNSSLLLLLLDYITLCIINIIIRILILILILDSDSHQSQSFSRDSHIYILYFSSILMRISKLYYLIYYVEVH